MGTIRIFSIRWFLFTFFIKWQRWCKVLCLTNCNIEKTFFSISLMERPYYTLNGILHCTLGEKAFFKSSFLLLKIYENTGFHWGCGSVKTRIFVDFLQYLLHKFISHTSKNKISWYMPCCGLFIFFEILIEFKRFPEYLYYNPTIFLFLIKSLTW